MPDLAVPFLKCVGERARGLAWHLRNSDLILHRPHTVASFNESSRVALRFDELLELLGRIEVANEISIFVLQDQCADENINTNISNGDFSDFKVCIDLQDSTVWTFFTDDADEFVNAAVLMQRRSRSVTLI